MRALTGVLLSEERAEDKGFPEPIPFLRIAAETPADLSRQPH
jgi:hypothetical protein